MAQALAGVRVLDLAGGIAGGYGSKLLAGLGADVILVEPPAGDETRRLGPFQNDLADPERSGLFLSIHAGKRSLVAGLTRPEDVALVRSLLPDADVLLTAQQPEELAALGLDCAVIRAELPRLIHISVTHFGVTGPYRGWAGDEIIDYAMGGYMYFGGDPEREPLAQPGYQAQHHAGMQTALAALVALTERERSGAGQFVDLSAVEAMLSAHSWTTVSWSHEGQVMGRTPTDLMRCADGWVFFMMTNLEGLAALTDRFDLLDDPRFATVLQRMQHRAELQELVAGWCASHTMEEIYRAGQELRVAVTPVYTVRDLHQYGQLAARDWFREVDHPVAGRVRLPGVPYLLPATPARCSRPAPLLGEHDAEIRQGGWGGADLPPQPPFPSGEGGLPEDLGQGEAGDADVSSPPSAGQGTDQVVASHTRPTGESAAPHASSLGERADANGESRSSLPGDPAGPLPHLGAARGSAGRAAFSQPTGNPAGSPPRRVGEVGRGERSALGHLRVLELTANWAGPLAGRYLADLGAEVIKIESPSRPATRGLHYPGGDGRTRPYNRAGYFNKLNRNKLGLSLDLSRTEGRELFLRLVRRADVVIENNSARVLGNLNLSYDVLRQVKPDIILCSMSGFGATGPERDYVAYGSNIETVSGLAALLGYHDDPTPHRTGSYYADPVAGAHGAIAVLAALRHRDRTGEGQAIDLSLLESGAALFGEALMEWSLNQRVPVPRGNRHPIFAPQGCYRCAGNDCWLALTVRSETEWQTLCRVIGREGWANAPEYADAACRRAVHDTIDEAISAWSANLDHYEAARTLQAAGVPAAPVLANWELLSDPHLFARGFYVPVPHTEVGVFPFPGMPWKFSRTPGAIRWGAPCFAEHNGAVFREILKLSEQEIQQLYDGGVTSDQPTVVLIR